MSDRRDIIVIGAGIAGASAAAELAADASVTLLEMEAQPGYHATGRSAAFFAASYGNEVARAATAASEPFFRAPPEDFTAVSLLRPRDCLFVGREDQRDQLDSLRIEIPSLEPVSPQAARDRVPLFSSDYPAHVLADLQGGDLDVDAVLQGYLKRFRQRGGELLSRCEVRSLVRRAGAWHLDCDERQFNAPIVVNAAGAWADTVAGIAGLDSLGITPMRRTACLVDVPAEYDITDWPLVVDADEAFYFKPDAGALLISPADETPSPACDAQADELDVATAVDRVMQVTDLQVRRINHRWAGLRSFAPDRTFVVGFDPRATGFFWLAGQGGYGVQSAPGLAMLTTHLVAQTSLEGSYAGLERYVAAIAPQRLITA
jgi:D-arginine dehydrogenase